MIRHNYYLETRNTFELKVGDVVQSHGSRFQLISRHQYEKPIEGDPVWFKTQYLGPVAPPHPDFAYGGHGEAIRHAFGARELHRWIIQGNRLAHWLVEVGTRSEAADGQAN